MHVKKFNNSVQKMSTAIDKALNVALKNLISELSRNGELAKFAVTLQKRKQYDECEQEYIQNQRLRKQLGAEYQSSDSEEQKQNSYNQMPHNQLKRLMRKNLVERRFDQDILLPIDEPKEQEQEQDEFATVKVISDEPNSTRDLVTPTELNIIQEAKEIVQEQPEKQHNFGLQFLIRELQKIQKIGLCS